MYYSRKLNKIFLALSQYKPFFTFSSSSSPTIAVTPFPKIVPKSLALQLQVEKNNINYVSGALSPPLSTLLPVPLDPFTTVVNLICSQLNEQKLVEFDDFHLEPNLAHLVVGRREGQEVISCVLLRCQSQPLVALRFFQWAMKSPHGLHLLPSPHNFSLLVHILTFSNHFSNALQILHHFLHAYPQIDAFQFLLDTSTISCCNSNLNVAFGMLLKVLVKMDRLNDALKTCRRVIHNGFIPDTNAFNSLLSSLLNNSCKEVKNNLRTCWHLYYQMISLEVPPNTFTFNILIRALCQEKDASNAKKFLEEMEIRGFDPDVITFNTLIYSYCQSRRLDDAFYLYRTMYHRGIQPDIVSYTILMSGLCKDNKVVEAHQLFNKIIQRGIIPDDFSYSVLVNGYCKEGRLREARLLVEQMIYCGLKPNEFTCRAIVEGHIRARKVLPCLNFIVILRKNEVMITSNIYKFLICYLCIEKKPNAARSLFNLMVQDGYQPDVEIYDMLIDSFCKCELLKEALLIKNEMVERQIEPGIHTYEALISCLCRLGKPKEGEQLLTEMMELDLKPNCHICSCLFTALCSNDELDKAESLLKYFAANFDVYDIASYNALIRLFYKEKGSNETLDLRDRMLEFGYVPNWETSKTLIYGLVKQNSLCLPQH